MAGEWTDIAGLIERLEASAAAFRKHPVHTADGDRVFLTVQAAEMEEAAALLAAAREEARPDPRPSPVGREEVARVIDPVAFKSWENMRAHCLAKGDDEQEAAATADWGHKSTMDAARAKADAILALFSPADGWRLVPTDPDGAMKMAGCAAPRSDATRDATNSLERQMETVADIYRAMLAAAPPPPGGQG